MSLFLMLMIAGLVGLALMALPGLGRHGHAGTAPTAPHGLGHVGHGAIHGGHGAIHSGHGAGHAASSHAAGSHAAGSHASGGSSGRGNTNLFRLIPSPRVIFSLMTLFGAVGYGLNEIGHLPPWPAGLLAVIPALLVERYAVTPLWNFLFRFQGSPSAPLYELTMSEAKAVTPFHNGRGMVSVVRDGRIVQFRAELTEAQKAMPVNIGDTLFVEEVDASKERLTVSLQ